MLIRQFLNERVKSKRKKNVPQECPFVHRFPLVSHVPKKEEAKDKKVIELSE